MKREIRFKVGSRSQIAKKRYCAIGGHGLCRRHASTFAEDEVRKLIAAAVAEAVAPLQARIAQLEAKVARLQKNLGNSSKSPSSDIVKPPPATRQRGGDPG
jgi:uncharacterized small protein (DUF1192 family)